MPKQIGALAEAGALLVKTFKLPKNLAECADALYVTRGVRLELAKQVEELEKREKQLREKLINELPKSKSTGIAGKLARASVYSEPVPTVKDWDKLWSYIQKTGHFDLLHKRLAADAVKSRWENKETVPGVERFNVVKVSLEKVAKS